MTFDSCKEYLLAITYLWPIYDLKDDRKDDVTRDFGRIKDAVLVYGQTHRLIPFGCVRYIFALKHDRNIGPIIKGRSQPVSVRCMCRASITETDMRKRLPQDLSLII